MKKTLMISVSGVRGIIGEGLSPEFIARYAAAAGTFYGQGKVVVGMDSRVSGQMVKSAVFSGLMSVGCDPVDIGLASTPTTQLATEYSDAVGGIVITASHNPIQWNALKLLSSAGMFLDETQGQAIKDIVDNERFGYVTYDKIGKSVIYSEASNDHVQAIMELPFINVPAIRSRNFKVAYDCVNGAGSSILPLLFDELGCSTFPLNQEPTGLFAHTPEPVPQNLGDLCAWTSQNHAEIGFAVDPDVDRLAIVSEQGQPIGEEYTVSMAAHFLLTIQSGQVVINMSTTRAVEDIAESLGSAVTRTKVGEIHVAKKMKEIGAVIGGEGNGGVILPDLHLGRDAPLAITLILQLLMQSDQTISSLWKSLPQYVMTKKKIAIGLSDPDKILIQIEQNHRDERINLVDGVKIDYEDSWVHIRKSNTEPIIRVISEAPDRETSASLCNATLEEISRLSDNA